MAYLIPIVLVLLLVTGFITFLVLNATKRSKPSEAENSGENDPQTMAASDPSPLGGTTRRAQTAHVPSRGGPGTDAGFERPGGGIEKPRRAGSTHRIALHLSGRRGD